MARQVNLRHRSLRSYLPIETSGHLYLLDLITYIACRRPQTGLERSMLNCDFRSNRSRSRLSDLKAHTFDRHVALVTFRDHYHKRVNRWGFAASLSDDSSSTVIVKTLRRISWTRTSNRCRASNRSSSCGAGLGAIHSRLCEVSTVARRSSTERRFSTSNHGEIGAGQEAA